jgi:hypothetical protein
MHRLHGGWTPRRRACPETLDVRGHKLRHMPFSSFKAFTF